MSREGAPLPGPTTCALTCAAAMLGACTLLVEVPDLSANYEARASDAGALGDAPSEAEPPRDAGAADYREVVLADGPRTYLRLGERAGATQAKDELGGAPFGYVGAVALGSPGLTGGTDTAANLDGVSAGLALGTGPDFAGREPFSFELWLLVRSLDAQNRMLFLKDGESGGRQALGAFLTAASGLTFERWVGGAVVAVNAPIDRATPHHVVLAYDGAKLAIFVDGAERASTADSRAQAPRSSPLTIGYDSSGQGKGFLDAVVDEVAVYGRALTSGEIARHYQVGRAR